MQNKAYDKRTIKRNVKKGTAINKDYDKHLASLEDMSANLEVIDVDDEACVDVMPKTEDYKE